MIKCYIAGPATGTHDYHQRFADAELEVFALGMHPVNPVKLPHLHDKKWSSYMREAIAAMMRCQAIYLLSGWKESEGASIESNLSHELEFERYYQSGYPDGLPF